MTTTATVTRDWEHLRSLLPGGYGRSSFAVGDRSPMVRRAHGYWVEDTDGRRLIDINNNMSVNLHGHAHPRITEAVKERIDDGLISIGIANSDELLLAEALIERSPWAEQVRFSNTGTEVVMLALRVARAGTGRDLVVVHAPGYHGTADAVLPSLGVRGVRGVPGPSAGQTLAIPRGDLDALYRAFEDHGEQIAAVLIDLCANRAGLTPLSAEYVAAAQDLARRSGAYLIVDEVVTYRNAYSGLVGEYGITPDIAVLGKTIGGGYPIGAIIGTRQALAPLDPTGFALEHGGTFTANPLSMAAGTTSLELFDAAQVARLNGLGARLEEGLSERFAGTDWEVRRSGSVFRLWPAAWSPEERAAAMKAAFWAQYERGVLSSSSGLSTLSTVMDEEVVDQLIEGIGAAAATVTHC